ncbi:GNAT family N-acetyltransferase [Nonomuraea basaltis]|nr:GNAT family N-acetyltransferase [Nonomuraea basaltis]
MITVEITPRHSPGTLTFMSRLETERLIMRPLTGEDFHDYAAMLSDPEVAGGLAEAVSTSPADAWRSLATFIGHREIRGYSHWALVEKVTGEFVGRAGPWQPYGFPGLGIGWCLARKHWGKGYHLGVHPAQGREARPRDPADDRRPARRARRAGRGGPRPRPRGPAADQRHLRADRHPHGGQTRFPELDPVDRVAGHPRLRGLPAGRAVDARVHPRPDRGEAT